MISIKAPTEPFELTLLEGLKVTVEPLTTLDMAISRAAADRVMKELQKSTETCVTAGLQTKVLNLEDPDVRSGLFRELLATDLAVRKIKGWEGVAAVDGDGTDAADCTPETIRALMAIWPLGHLFFDKYTDKMTELIAAKKDSGIVADGTSPVTPSSVVPPIAGNASETVYPAQTENPA